MQTAEIVVIAVFIIVYLWFLAQGGDLNCEPEFTFDPHQAKKREKSSVVIEEITEPESVETQSMSEIRDATLHCDECYQAESEGYQQYNCATCAVRQKISNRGDQPKKTNKAKEKAIIKDDKCFCLTRSSREQLDGYYRFCDDCIKAEAQGRAVGFQCAICDRTPVPYAFS